MKSAPHSVARVSQHAVWEPDILGQQLKAELAKGLTAKEQMAEVFASMS